MSDPAAIQALRAAVADSAFYGWSGMTLVAVSLGEVTLELDLQDHHVNIQGLAHGGVLATLADASMGLAVRSAVETGRRHVTVDMNVHYLRPVTRGRIVATGRAVRVGREIAYAETEIVDRRGKTLARASGTYSVSRPPD